MHEGIPTPMENDGLSLIAERQVIREGARPTRQLHYVVKSGRASGLHALSSDVLVPSSVRNGNMAWKSGKGSATDPSRSQPVSVLIAGKVIGGPQAKGGARLMNHNGEKPTVEEMCKALDINKIRPVQASPGTDQYSYDEAEMNAWYEEELREAYKRYGSE